MDNPSYSYKLRVDPSTISHLNVPVDQGASSSPNADMFSEWGEYLRALFVSCLTSVENVLLENFIYPIQRFVDEWTDDKRCEFVDQLNSIDNLFAENDVDLPGGVPDEQTEPPSIFLSKADLCTVLEKLADQISPDCEGIAGQLSELEEKLKVTIDRPLTIKEWAYVSCQLDAIAIKYKRNYNQQVQSIRSDYRQAKQTYKMELAQYKKNDELDSDARTEAQEKLDQLYDDVSKLGQVNLNRQHFLTQIIQDLKFMSNLAWSSLAQQRIVTRLKKIYDEKLTPGYLRLRSGYVSGGVSTGLDLLNAVTAEVKGTLAAGATKIDVVSDENFPGLVEFFDMWSGAKASTKLGGIATLSAEYTQGLSAGRYTEYKDIETLVRSRFNELVKELRKDAEIKPYLSRAAILGAKPGFIMDLITDSEVIKIDEWAEENRLNYDTVKQRLNIFRTGITGNSFQSLREAQIKSSNEEARLLAARSPEDKQLLIAAIHARNTANDAVKKITIPKVEPFRAGLLKNFQLITFNVSAGLSDSVLSVAGGVSVKREKSVLKAVTYTGYCRFLLDPIRPVEIKNNIRGLVEQQRDRFMPTLKDSWLQLTEPVEFTQQKLRLDTQFNYLKEDFRLYTNAQLTIRKLEGEIARFQTTLPPEQSLKINKAMKAQIKKENAFCKAIMQRYSAKDVTELLYQMAILNAYLLMNVAPLGETMNEFQQEFLAFEDALLSPKFAVSLENLKERAQVKNVADYEVTTYEVSFSVQGGENDLVKVGNNVTIRFEDHQSKNEPDPFDFLDLIVGAGVVVGGKLFNTISLILNQAAHLIVSPTLGEVGQIFNSAVLAPKWMPQPMMTTDVGLVRQMRWFKPHNEPVAKFTRILTRDLVTTQTKVDLEVPIPTSVPAITAKIGAGYSRMQSELRLQTFTGNSLINWIVQFMQGLNKETGEIRKDSYWKVIENTQQAGFAELFSNRSIENEITKMAANVENNKYLTQKHKENFRKARGDYIAATRLFQQENTPEQYDDCLKKLRRLLLAFEPHWTSSNLNSALIQETSGFMKKNGRWAKVQMSEPVQMHKKLS